MAKYLKLFGTEEEYNSFVESDKFILPNVSFIERPVTVVFNPSSNHDPYNGYEYVDLGLPSGLKWAKCNIGAEKEIEIGLYFAWGEVIGYGRDEVESEEGKKLFNWGDYKYCNGTRTTLTKYNNSTDWGEVDNKIVLDLEDDAATVNMGGSWRMPTESEFNELLNYTTNAWTTVNSVNGRLFTGNNGNTLFFPASGYCEYGEVFGVGSGGEYWSSSLNPSPYCSWYMSFSSGNSLGVGFSGRYSGRAVRAVVN